jgi:hypothetical protein
MVAVIGHLNLLSNSGFRQVKRTLLEYSDCGLDARVLAPRGDYPVINRNTGEFALNPSGLLNRA